MNDNVVYRKLTGRVYYEPTGGNTGQIKIVTFGELSEEETRGLSMAVVDPALLIPLVDGSANPNHHMLFLNPSGHPTIIKKSVEAQLALFEEVLRPVHQHAGQAGLVLTIDGLGGASVMAHDLPGQIYPENSPVFVYITAPNQPNLLRWQTILNLGEAIRRVDLSNLPVGFPVANYSVWCISAGPLIPMWWSSL